MADDGGDVGGSAKIADPIDAPKSPWPDQPPVDDVEVQEAGGEVGDYVPKKVTDDLTGQFRRPVPVLYGQPLGSNAITTEEIDAFLDHVGKTGAWNQAAYYVGRSGFAFKQLAKEDPFFALRVQQAKQDFIEGLEMTAVRLARDGVDRPVFGKEGLLGYERTHSESLLLALLRANYPAKWDRKNTNAVDPGAGQSKGALVVPGQSASREEWEREHGPAAQGKLTQKVTRRVNRRDIPTGEQ